MAEAISRIDSRGTGGGDPSVPAPLASLPGQLFFNRELSWLEFNGRVLEEALDRDQPLLERLKFLAIFSTNLDEFFMIRVSGLKDQLDAEVTDISPDEMSPAMQLKAISEHLRPTLAEHIRCLKEEVLPGLKKHGIEVVPYKELSGDERASLDSYFTEHVFPVLTPQAVDPGHPFPYISNLSLNLGVMIEPLDAAAAPEMQDEPRFTRIKVPPVVPRLVPIREEETRFVLLEELIAANLVALFPGMRAGECHAFRVTRDADIEIREDEADDLLRVMEQELRQRRFGTAVRLEVAATMPAEMVNYIMESLDLTDDDGYTIDGPLKIPAPMELYKLDRPELKDRPLIAQIPAAFKTDKPIFDVLKAQDVLVHHPYDSFSTVVDFIKTAAVDPDVLAIKMTLYRTGQDSPVVQALMQASERGKQVAVLIELKARFDEESNIEWAKRLEHAGVHVVYGMLGLKTHCKVALVVRREGERLRRYVHIGTGNYNPGTARIYTDIGLFTTDEEIGADATELFNYLTGFSRQCAYRRLLIAPVNLREGMIALIRREIAHHQQGRPARIVAKLNSLTDTEIIRTLYEASQAGVEIDLIVRGVCRLKPGVENLSESIAVTSIVGRFLEHSRIIYFANGGEADVYIGSADWMRRNLDHRIELVTPISDPQLKKYLKEDVLDVLLRDNVKSRRLTNDGTYERVRFASDEERFDSQSHFARQTPTANPAH